MLRNYEIYLEDVLEAINRIQAYMEGITRMEFESNRMRFDAIIRNLEVIGEAVKQVPEPLREEYPSVEWRKIAGLRACLTSTVRRGRTAIKRMNNERDRNLINL